MSTDNPNEKTTNDEQAEAEAATQAPLNGGEHATSGSFTGTHEGDVSFDGAFTDSEIPKEGAQPGESAADKAGFEGSYTESEGVE